MNTKIKPPRKDVMPKVRMQLDDFYGNECVVCGRDPLFVELAHTNDRREQSELGNVIPLCFNANRGMQRATYASAPSLADEIDPYNLISAGHAKFRRGQYPQAYGCYRLASHLLDRSEYVSRAVECLDFSIGALRPLGHRDLLRYTILYARDYIARRSTLVTPYWRADFLSKVALVMMDYLQWDAAADLGGRIEELLISDSGATYPEEQATRTAAQKRRISIVKGDLNGAIGLLKEAKETQYKYQDLTGLGTSLHVEALLQLNKNGVSTKAQEIIEEALDLEHKLENKWLLAELYLLKGFFETRQKSRWSRKRALDFLQLSLKGFTAYNIAQEPIRISGVPFKLDPGVELTKLGLKPDGELRTRGAPPLTRRELKRIVEVVFALAGRGYPSAKTQYCFKLIPGNTAPFAGHGTHLPDLLEARADLHEVSAPKTQVVSKIAGPKGLRQPTLAPSDALRLLKTNSSRWLHRDRRIAGFEWQTGYGAFSVSHSVAPAVMRYIADQEKHHRRVPFQEEFLSFLKKNGIDFDNRYIWA